MSEALKAHFAMVRATLDDAEAVALSTRGDDDGLTAVGKLVRSLVIDADRANYSRDVAQKGQAAAEARVEPLTAEVDRLNERVVVVTLANVEAAHKIEALEARIAELMDLVDEADREAAFDLVALIEAQQAFSVVAFGPGERTAAVVDHIRKELREVLADPSDVTEWIDVVTLALDGAWRAGHTPQAIAEALVAKRLKNEARTWPDWRTAPKDKAIEHVREDDGDCSGGTCFSGCDCEDDGDEGDTETKPVDDCGVDPFDPPTASRDRNEAAVSRCTPLPSAAKPVDVSLTGMPSPVLPTAPKPTCHGCRSVEGRGHFAGCEGGAA